MKWEAQPVNNFDSAVFVLCIVYTEVHKIYLFWMCNASSFLHALLRLEVCVLPGFETILLLPLLLAEFCLGSAPRQDVAWLMKFVLCFHICLDGY